MYTLQLFSPYAFLVMSLSGLLALALGWSVWTVGNASLRRHLLTVALGLPFVLFLFAVVSLSVNVPYWDDYDAVLGYLVNPLPERLHRLFAFHNEHRIAFVRVVAEAVRGGGAWPFDFRTMIYAGNALFLCYAVLLLGRLKKGGEACGLWRIPAAWALLSILMYENMLWALTSVQNNAVLLFAWLALACFERGGHPGWLVASFVSAFVCTYTSGPGLFIWFCLAGMGAKRQYVDGKRLPPLAWAVLAGVGAASVFGYLHGFHSQGSGALQQVLAHPQRLFLYAAYFCGAAAHFPALALPLGVAVLTLVALLAWRVRRIRDDVTLFFLGFLLCAVFSAALFRCGDLPTQALSFRYRVIAVSIVVCCGMLTYEQFVQPQMRSTRRLCAVATALCVFMNLCAYLLAYPQLVARRDAMVDGVKKWPADCSGLVFPGHDRASDVLTKSVRQGVYRPPQ